MKIAVDLTPMRPGGQNGGVKPAILEILKGLKAHLGEELQYLFLTADDTHNEAPSSEIDSACCVLRRTGRGNISQTLELATTSRVSVRNLLKKDRIDLLYCPFGTVQFAFAQVPTVAMVVDILHRDYPYSLPVQTREWRELQFRKLIKSADYFQVISEFTSERLQILYDISPEQIFITRLPIHGRLTSTQAQREPFFFYPANFWIHKNHETLLVAYQIYLSRTTEKPPWNLVLTGYHDERMAILQQLAVDLGVATHIKFVGHVAESDLAKLYATASCLVFPSLYEGYGIPIVEAMAFGVPVICGTNGSIPEIAGDAAFYAEMRNPSKLANALLTVAGDEFLRQSLVALGREQLAAFDFSVEIRRLADLFKLITARATPVQRHRARHLNEVLSSAAYYARSIARRALNAAVEVPVRMERFSSKIP